jgi:hypothetical protein
MARTNYDDYESTGQWMVACVIASQIENYNLTDMPPSQQEISDAIDGANAGNSLGEFIGAAWDAAREVAYDMFPQFRDPEEE